MNITLEISSSEQLSSICGSFDRHLEAIAKSLNVEMNNKGEAFVIKGDNAHIAARVLQDLTTLSATQNIQIHDVEMAIKTYSRENSPEQTINIKTKRKFIHIRNLNQQKYVLNIQNRDCTFGIGPAGTGKTYLAVARAVEALEHSAVRRIVLVRPAVEAGEKLGFLPGDMNEKVDPYLRPIYDALYEMLGFDKVEKLLNKNIIEVAPLAFMRGRTLNESFIILDEAQNTTIPQMKMFLTRLGFGSKMVITGDVTQIDLANPKQSGLIHAAKVLAHEDKISFCYFETKDVVRHNLVQRIVSAYEKFE
ncbi:Phosphate starvation-inducible protein PhoH, predicted ATPase [Bathymodiolus thermophilus thioautotrophic gill symbiont]|uniref:PhoH-like protein n=1 Tax=Bathymodiolus thermophilus thioautotrophic gill symbiont TaxID=2360 RepID=A0A1J5TXH9_9GAMM|nr:PhoH family protein [Bathymodiolus thermophilus thioautotrophic gill symbiont]OIR25555.1 phosphate starvation-inducible protein PhoH [Bathymodiolus thermophilus thioautotrophic gill symbiont]CAB5501884.1 Phosphate starvation-inducible protein PhoH, predicted ATPase [Bathymodiolus thermophilus thioautotrophic gill symbiont]